MEQIFEVERLKAVKRETCARLTMAAEFDDKGGLWMNATLVKQLVDNLVDETVACCQSALTVSMRNLDQLRKP